MADSLAPDDSRRVVAMRDVLAHRGPDDAGLYVDSRAALGHRRLSIVDLAAGKQPLANEDETVWISFNGEIYNHAEVRHILEQRGHVYRTRSDTETIVHAYEEWGDECVTRLRGMFAFAIWDVRRQRLLLARDRLGVKPLYWAQTRNGLLFASEIKAILRSGAIEARPNYSALPELLAIRSISGAETLFEGIHKLLPGHVLTFEAGVITIRKYWDVPIGGDQRERRATRADDVRQFRSLLEESIRLRLMSDVPLGVFLSGGIDSSAIAAFMARMVDQPLQTFSVGFRARAFNEFESARLVADSIGAIRHEIVIDERDFFGALPRLVWHEDEPIAHPSSVPLYFVSKLAREHVTVVLTGEGSDELLAGYGKYPKALFNWHAGSIYSKVVPAPVRSLAKVAFARLPRRIGRYLNRSFLGVDHDPSLTFFDTFAGMNLQRQQQVLAAGRDDVSAASAYASSMEYFDSARSAPLLERILYADMKTYLVELLMKQDQMSMAASIESRVPFLDHHLVEFAAGLPADRKLGGLSTKRILREAVKDVLPRQILERPKMGFPVPFSDWARNEWSGVIADVLLDRRARERGVIDPKAVERLLTSTSRAQWDTQDADAIWQLLNLELWHRTFIDGDGVQTLPTPSAASHGAFESVNRWSES